MNCMYKLNNDRAQVNKTRSINIELLRPAHLAKTRIRNANTDLASPRKEIIHISLICLQTNL